MQEIIQNHFWKKKLMKNQGFTLFELILAITLLFVIILATFTGLQFAFHTMASSKAFSENAYEIQKDYEKELTKVRTLLSNTDEHNYSSTIAGGNIVDEIIEFEWDSVGFRFGVDPLEDFDARGIRIDKHTTGGDYLDATMYMFIPVKTEP
ncbi:MAG: hypothetical protein CVU95_00630 [Firmicutes bacterium HGW-Firmicutes-2]|jgi:competence protein ComGC|nr:MAG: hypothetical protein CVU95_00630 [Firmicutes bacterium HGW-Firmicutes-2]